MAEYLIQDTSLDAIADAINAKTGGSSAMTPAQMVTAIAAIPGGGGGGWELIAEATTTEDVEAFRVDIPAAKQNMAAYKVVYNCTLLLGTASQLYGAPRLNSIAVGQPWAEKGAAQQYTTGIAKSNDGHYVMAIRGDVYPTSGRPSSVEYVALVGLVAGNIVAAGSNIKVYGIGEPT